MTPHDLDGLLTTAGQPPLASPSQLPDALDRLEAAASAHPRDRHLEAAFEALLRRDAVERCLPEVVAGVRRDRLVRWSPWCSTWSGTAVEDGRAVMVRAVDAHGSPRRVRQLQRQAGLLGLRPNQGAVVVDLPGQPLHTPRVADPGLAGRMVQGLVALGSRVGTPPLSRDELREVGGEVRVCCLTVPLDGDDRGAVGSLAAALLPDGEGPLHDVLRGLAEHPVPAEEAGPLVVSALARELAGVRHHLLARWTATSQGRRIGQLAQLVHRLGEALPPPRGRAAAGVDLDGQVLAVASDEDSVQFGPVHAMERVYSTDEGMDAPMARRVLRAQAAAPPNPHLSRQVGGDAAFNDAIGRWLAASLRLRTLSMLLESQVKAPVG